MLPSSVTHAAPTIEARRYNIENSPLGDEVWVTRTVEKHTVPLGTEYKIQVKRKIMANTYTQLHVHVVIIVQNRKCLIRPGWKNELYKYITGIVQGEGHKLLQVNGMPDHIHLLIGLRPIQALSKLMQLVKQNTTVWINQNRLTNNHFSWQSGYAAFSLATTDVPRLIKYIQEQEVHHKKKTFEEEYIEFLQDWEVEYDDRYLFKPVL